VNATEIGPSGLARRSLRPELMDGEQVPFEEFERCLRELERINRWTFAYRPTLAWLDRVVRARPPGRPPGRPLRVLDVGSGHGDMLRRVAAWARRRGVPVSLTGVDLNPWSERAAREAAPGLDVRWVTADVFDLPAGALPEGGSFDVVLSALFTHHLDDASLLRFLAWMEENAALGWFVNDLHRHAVPLAAARAIGAALPVGRLVAHDAPLSVERAFTRADWRDLLARAGLDGVARVEWFMPFRLCVGRIR
jgi:SAM-dependent methyltransferase